MRLAEATKAFDGGDYIGALTVLSGMLDDGRTVDVLLLLGETFAKLGLSADARDIFVQAADLAADDPRALRRAAEASFAAGDDQQAQFYGMTLFRLQPDDAGIAWLLASSFIRTGEPELARYVRAPLAGSKDPDHIALAADLYADEERDPAALAVFGAFADLHPDDPYAALKYMAVARDFCDYDTLEALEARWGADLRAGTPSVLEGETPYANLLHCGEEQLNRLATNAGLKTGLPGLFARGRRRIADHAWGTRIRIGYLSNDLWSDHATMRLLRSVLEAHDRARFEVTLYCHTAERFTQADTADRTLWGRIVPIHAMSDAEAAAAIRRDGIDLLVDLKGHTGGARCGILNCGAAPVQVAWLGFPGSTTGVDCDYVIGDPVVLPETSRPFYHEKFCRLPESYQPNDPVHRVLPPPSRRAALGLPDDRFVFAAFNIARKISLETLESWAAILRRADRAILWMMIDSDLARRNVLDAMAKRGVGAERIVFAAKTAYGDHIARLQAADLGLDTFPYNGHTTTSDQLWAGLPVLTVKGTNFASRVSESLLNAIGLPDLVMPDRDTFVARAVSLANDPDAIDRYKRHLTHNRFTAPLFDAERFCRHLESAYGIMVERARDDQPPAAFDVPALPPRLSAFR